MNIARKLKISDNLKRLSVNFIEADWYVVFSHQYQASNPERVQQFWKMLSSAREKLTDDSVDAYFED